MPDWDGPDPKGGKLAVIALVLMILAAIAAYFLVPIWLETNTTLEIVMATQQEILDQLAATSASLDGIQTDITSLKAMVDAGANLDTIKAAVDALASKAAGIDAETP